MDVVDENELKIVGAKAVDDWNSGEDLESVAICKEEGKDHKRGDGHEQSDETVWWNACSYFDTNIFNNV